MKKFLCKTAVFCLVMLITVAGVNYFGDAARLFDDEYERELARHIAGGRHVTNIWNYNERLFQKELITRWEGSPDIAVMGSSRTMLIGSDMVGDRELLNSSVNGASIEDLVAIYQIYKSSDKLPETFIIGIDPWTFNANNGQDRWQAVAEYYHEFHDRDPGKRRNRLPLDQLFSFTYFQSSVRALFDQLVKRVDPLPTGEEENATNTKLSDGSLVYGQSRREADQEEVNAEAQAYVAGEVYSIEGYEEIDPDSWRDFTLLIEDMAEEGIEIRLFLAPYHPIAFDTVEEYPMVAEAERLVSAYAESMGIEVYGSFDPEQSGVGQVDFYDAVHSREPAVRDLLEF